MEPPQMKAEYYLKCNNWSDCGAEGYWSSNLDSPSYCPHCGATAQAFWCDRTDPMEEDDKKE